MLYGSESTIKDKNPAFLKSKNFLELKRPMFEEKIKELILFFGTEKDCTLDQLQKALTSVPYPYVSAN